MNKPSTFGYGRHRQITESKFRIFIVAMKGIYFENKTTNSNNESTIYL